MRAILAANSESPQSLLLYVFAGGVVLLVVGLAGRVKIREIDIGISSVSGRVTIAILGAFVAAFAVWMMLFPRGATDIKLDGGTQNSAAGNERLAPSAGRIEKPPITPTVLYRADVTSPKLVSRFAKAVGIATPVNGALILNTTKVNEDRGIEMDLREAGLLPSYVTVEMELSVPATIGTAPEDRCAGIMFAIARARIVKAELSGEKAGREQDHSYCFVLSGNRSCRISRWNDYTGARNRLVEVHPPTLQALTVQTAKLTLNIRGKTIEYFVNDERLGQYEADEDLGGFIGLYVTGSTTVALHSLVVRDLPK